MEIKGYAVIVKSGKHSPYIYNNIFTYGTGGMYEHEEYAWDDAMECLEKVQKELPKHKHDIESVTVKVFLV